MNLQPLVELAQQQRCLVTYDQVAKLGVSKRSWYRLLGTGLFTQLHPGVALLAGAPRTRETHIHGALLAVGTGTLASHRSAAHLWGGPIPASATGEKDPVDLIMLRRGRSPELDGVIAHRPTDLADLRGVERHGLQCTSPLRTALDLGAVLPPDVVANVVEHFVMQRFVSVGMLRSAIRKHSRRGRHGIGALRTVLDDWALGDKPPDSVLEPAMAKLLVAAGITEFAFHHRVKTAGGVFELDFGLLPEQIDVEVDGWAWHGSRAAQRRDKQRDAYLVAAGWAVQRFTWHQVLHRPDEVIALVRSARDARHARDPRRGRD